MKSKTGVAFADFITTEKVKHVSGYSHRSARIRSSLLFVAIVISIGVIFARLITLQVINGYYYRLLSDNNRTRTKIIHAPRGIIFDRSSIPLVYNTPGFRERVNGKTSLLTREDATNRIARGDNNLEIDTLREYPFKESMAHLLGYIGEISKSELEGSQFEQYQVGSLIGKMGVEKYYETRLKGVDGKMLLEVDAAGRFIRSLGQTEPIAGSDLFLTIDSGLQKTTYQAMKDVTKGAVVVSTPQGEVLAMVSKPSFDSNLFTLGEGYKVSSDAAYANVSDVLTDNITQPLLNRTISGEYPPGSTFKLIVAAAGLQNKIIDDTFQVNDTGVLKIGDFSFANWYYTQYGKTEGQVNVVKALKRSNDIFFYRLAEKVGIDKLSQTAKLFGLGNPLGIDSGEEVGGVIPTASWKERVIKEPWYLGDTYHYGIGQGYLLTTPLQVNAWTQVIANGGTLYKPHLLKDGSLQQVLRKNLLDQKSLSLIREGMSESCNTGGVAWPLFEYKVKNEKLQIDRENITQAVSSSAEFRHVSLGCKTGTAQHGNETTLPHAWITLIAPLYRPQIVVTVLAESSGEGSNIAAPIAKQILDYWFSR